MATVSFRISDELKRELDELSAEKGYHLMRCVMARMAVRSTCP